MAEKRIYVNHDLKDNVAIGFGATSPSYTSRLEIKDDLSGAASSVVTVRRSDNSLMSLLATGGTGDTYQSYYNASGSLKIQLHSNSPSYINTGTGLAIGHNTTIGLAKLYVRGAGTTTATKSLSIGNSAGTELFYVDDAGRVTSLISGYYTQHGRFAHQEGGQFNTFLGRLCGENTTGGSNVALGSYAMNQSTSASENVAVGHGALQVNTTGDSNTCIGYNAGRLAVNQSQTVSIGNRAAASATTNLASTFVGSQSGQNIISSRYNTFIGNTTGISSPTTIEDCIALGYGASPLTDNSFVIGSGSSGSGIYNTYIGRGEQWNSVDLTGSTTIQPTGVFTTETDASCGFDLIIAGGKGVGTGSGSDLIFQTAPGGLTGSTQNALVEAMRISGVDSSIDFTQYGSGTFTGTAAYTLAVDASGNVIEVAASGSGYAADITLVANTTLTVTHSLGSTDIIVQLKDSTGELITVDTVDNYTANTVDITSSIAGTYRIIIK
jgi:hypothetical protein